MTDVRALHDRLERTFRGAFHVRDVAEAPVSFDAQMPAATALERAGRRVFTTSRTWTSRSSPRTASTSSPSSSPP